MVPWSTQCHEEEVNEEQGEEGRLLETTKGTVTFYQCIECIANEAKDLTRNMLLIGVFGEMSEAVRCQDT